MNPTILQSKDTDGDHDDVLRAADIQSVMIETLLNRYGLRLKTVAKDKEIPGSYWGDEEAGLIGNDLLVRVDTPLHSILHEACHYVCMDKARRNGVHTDAGGDYDEENAVCYLQILLAGYIENFGRQRMFKDMDQWGYTFRLGSAQAWFEKDSEDARLYLQNLGLIDSQDCPTFQLRN
jgi:hypothetical protein